MIGLLLKVFQASLKVGDGGEGLSNDLGIRSVLMTGAQILQGGKQKKKKKKRNLKQISNVNKLGRIDFFLLILT